MIVFYLPCNYTSVILSSFIPYLRQGLQQQNVWLSEYNNLDPETSIAAVASWIFFSKSKMIIFVRDTVGTHIWVRLNRPKTRSLKRKAIVIFQNVFQKIRELQQPSSAHMINPEFFSPGLLARKASFSYVTDKRTS